ncbi:hypothetical protein QFC21_002116 [Naganishia friedmannii]|uniref:Uncharacterized protein n=1 Tax=Naganishia friedmannii TaxID=89922 RepID=A0ACC2VZ18_9TREE|nr:hypothetical protein QFC21_002116 [Naganishia friedmannii]
MFSQKPTTTASLRKENTKFVVRYDPDVAIETGSSESYKLLEISPELAKVIEAAEKDGEEGITLTMKGAPSDDAVICTPSQTFSLRTITVSNSMLFLRPALPPTTGLTGNALDTEVQQQQNLLIQDTCHEILELTPTVPRLDRVEKLLRDTCWAGMRGFGDTRGVKRSQNEADNDNDHSADSGNPQKKKKPKRYTRAQLQSLIQASDAELDAGLKERNVIEVDDLDKDFSVLADVSVGVMGVFGDIVRLDDDAGEVWRAHLPRLVKELGKGLLSLESTLDPPTADDFIERWKEQIGPEYEHLLTMGILEIPAHTPHFPYACHYQQGEYLLKQPSSASLIRSPLVVPFSVTSLPTDPAQRFSDLFATRSQWRPEDMQPFLRGLTPAGDRKALDKLVVKYVRVVKGSGKNGAGAEVWWHARR